MKKLIWFIPFLVSGFEGNSDATIEFENPYVRLVRVQYKAHEKTGVHDHPASPNVYVYLTDGGRLKMAHDGHGYQNEPPVIRPVVKAGGIRFQKGVSETHAVEELDGISSQYLRIELKTQPLDLPEADVRRAPDDRNPFENRMLRIMRITCPALSTCPASQHPEDPAVVVSGTRFAFVQGGSLPLMNSSNKPMEQVRVELKTPPQN